MFTVVPTKMCQLESLFRSTTIQSKSAGTTPAVPTLAANQSLAKRTPKIEDFEDSCYLQVDLIEYEEKCGRQPVFTRKLLEKIKTERALAKEETLRGPSSQLITITHPAISQSGEFVVWSNERLEDEDDHVLVRFMPRVKLHPVFQKHCYQFSNITRRLRSYNSGLIDKSWISVPYDLESHKDNTCNQHTNSKIMESYESKLLRTGSLWRQSKSCLQLKGTIAAVASKFSSITKIACFGLGTICIDTAFYDSSIQHMAVFTMAAELEAKYQQKVEILLQDPFYSCKDSVLLPKLARRQLTRLEDPDTLLAIDSNTIVVTAHLPTEVPLLQMIADLGTEDPERRPAAILCDKMKLDVAKRMYSLTDRSSPSVARFLTEGYTVQNFDGHRLEQKFYDDVYGGSRRPYWLNRMELYVRK